MLRVNIEGDKYTIVCDEKGDVRIERYGKPWINDTIRQIDGLTDIRRNLDNPGKV